MQLKMLSSTVNSLLIAARSHQLFSNLSLNANRIVQNHARYLTQEHMDKQFVDMETPYKKPAQSCILCKHKIQLDYKNPRLLSQFISPLNGFVYDKHITGLCELQQTILQREIKKSRASGLMPIFFKSPKYNKDPRLFDPSRPQRPNPH